MPVPNAIGTTGWFAHGSSAIPFTVVTADWCNALQGEIMNVILAANITLDKTRQDQLLAALNKLFAKTTDLSNYVKTTDLGPYATDADLANYVKKTDAGGLQTALGFTPVQQGGGAGQNVNKIYLGWDGGGLKLQVDATDLGRLVRFGDFSGSFPGNGYTKLPNGLIFQWGRFISVTGNGDVYTFPLAFPNTCLTITGSDDGSGLADVGLTAITKTQAKMWAGFNNYPGAAAYFGGIGITWIAIGY